MSTQKLMHCPQSNHALFITEKHRQRYWKKPPASEQRTLIYKVTYKES